MEDMANQNLQEEEEEEGRGKTYILDNRSSLQQKSQNQTHLALAVSSSHLHLLPLLHCPFQKSTTISYQNQTNKKKARER